MFKSYSASVREQLKIKFKLINERSPCVQSDAGKEDRAEKS